MPSFALSACRTPPVVFRPPGPGPGDRVTGVLEEEKCTTYTLHRRLAGGKKKVWGRRGGGGGERVSRWLHLNQL